MKLKTWLKLCELVDRLKKPEILKAFAYYIIGWGIIIYLFDLFSSWWCFGFVFVAIMLISRGLQLDLTKPCPAEDNCPFRDRLLRGYWEEKK